LQNVPGRFSPHVLMGQVVQLVMDERHQLGERIIVALTPFLQELNDLVGLRFH